MSLKRVSGTILSFVVFILRPHRAHSQIRFYPFSALRRQVHGRSDSRDKIESDGPAFPITWWRPTNANNASLQLTRQAIWRGTQMWMSTVNRHFSCNPGNRFTVQQKIVPALNISVCSISAEWGWRNGQSVLIGICGPAPHIWEKHIKEASERLRESLSITTLLASLSTS